jgi:hypothetical protein
MPCALPFRFGKLYVDTLPSNLEQAAILYLPTSFAFIVPFLREVGSQGFGHPLIRLQALYRILAILSLPTLYWNRSQFSTNGLQY